MCLRFPFTEPGLYKLERGTEGVKFACWILGLLGALLVTEVNFDLNVCIQLQLFLEKVLVMFHLTALILYLSNILLYSFMFFHFIE